MIAPNTIVGGRYRVVKALGGGGMKLVYLAEDLRLAARPCALAEMVDTFTNPDAQRQAVAAFQREADMLAQLSNEHIPRVFDRFSEANHHYLVMEYINGVTLEDELRQGGGKLPSERVIDIAIQILDTLEYLHHLDPPVIYRDLKPSNVMVTADGQAKLIDFGIARFFQPLTNATMIGTQGYAPPEQYRGKVETRSDLYALGATMHHAISGRDPAAEPPFSFPLLRTICPDLDARLAAVVDKALAYDIDNRIRDANEFKQRLIEIRTGTLNQAAAQAPISNGISGPRAQMNLPPGGPPLTPPPSPSSTQRPMAMPSGSDRNSAPTAPTVLSVASDINCPRCGRPIPADSRFCSYCAADLRVVSEPSAPAAAPGDETVVLSEPHAPRAPRNPGLTIPWPSGPRSARMARRHNGLRRPLIVIALLCLGAVIVAKLIIQSNAESTTPPGYNSGSSESDGSIPPRARAEIPPGYGYGDTEPGLDPDRAKALRQALDDQGYKNVHFRMAGNTMILSGSVPDEMDRAIVQMLAFNLTGVDSFEDHLKVRDIRDYSG